MDSIWKLGVLLSVIFLSVNTAHAGPSKEVRDWNVYCENNLGCLASTYPDIKGFGSFGFRRASTANAPLVFEVYTYPKLKPGSVLVFSVPGELQSLSLDVPQANGKDSTLRLQQKELDEVLLPALLAGKSLAIAMETEEGPLNVKLSLAGVTGAALFMDEAQQRLGNRDALVKKGDGEPKDAVTRVVDLNDSAALPKEVAELWKGGPDSCGETIDNEDLLKQYGGFRVDMENNSALYVLPCGYPGAYNYPYVSYGHDRSEKRARRLLYPTIGSIGPTVMEHAYNVDWDDGTSRLHAFAKGRGIGDCGLINIWQFNGDGSYGNYELVEERRKDNCDGENTEFPLVWPIK